MLKDPFLTLLNLAGFFLNIAYTVPLLYFPASLKAIGYSQTFSTNFIMAYSVASIVGRLGAGQLSDYIHPLNILIVCHLITSIAIFTLWYLGSSLATYASFYVIYGLFGINYFSLAPSMISARYPYKKISQANALSFLILGIAVFMSIPLIGFIFQKVGKRTDFSQIIIICGVFYILSFITFVILKLYLKKIPLPTEDD
ncbi:Riboflavin transporter MCH5 [Smittium mucronatum]|uniref:Riboflavin transporter MCH5 n=1 Tax=Smittium mucronatum TaxID=133383 RepID=A0A1R0GSM6_9FUNG|nr:Riboflavin transporter MCH5 [Smittium mucronatum]